MTSQDKECDLQMAELIKYVRDEGISRVREISRADWKSAGVDDQDTVVWNEDNKYLVPAEKFSGHARAIIEDTIKLDKSFQIVQIADPAPTPARTATK